MRCGYGGFHAHAHSHRKPIALCARVCAFNILRPHRRSLYEAELVVRDATGSVAASTVANMSNHTSALGVASGTVPVKQLRLWYPRAVSTGPYLYRVELCLRRRAAATNASQESSNCIDHYHFRTGSCSKEARGGWWVVVGESS